MKTWSEAYKENTALSFYAFRSLSTFDHEIPTDGQFLHHLYQYPYLSQAKNYMSFSMTLPKATEQPLFYVGIYAAIGLASASASVLSVTAQYTGALRASRILFKSAFSPVVVPFLIPTT